MKEWYLNTAELAINTCRISAGDKVYLSGTVYTARDAAHKRMTELFSEGRPLPFAPQNSVIYYAGPTPTPDGMAIGSCGPTTSSRMDIYTPELLDLGVKCMIGKGERSDAVCNAIVKNHAIYLCAIGGAGALAAKSVIKSEVIAFEDLGCESVKKLEIQNFPLICAIDCKGGNLFKK